MIFDAANISVVLSPTEDSFLLIFSTPIDQVIFPLESVSFFFVFFDATGRNGASHIFENSGVKSLLLPMMNSKYCLVISQFWRFWWSDSNRFSKSSNRLLTSFFTSISTGNCWLRFVFNCPLVNWIGDHTNGYKVTVTSTLVTDVKNYLCWWQVWDVSDRFEILVFFSW